MSRIEQRGAVACTGAGIAALVILLITLTAAALLIPDAASAQRSGKRCDRQCPDRQCPKRRDRWQLSWRPDR